MTKGNLKRILEDVYGDECTIVGDESVTKLIDSDEGVQYYKSKGGSDFDLSGTLIVLSTGLSIIKTVIEIYQKIKNDKNNAEVMAETVKLTKQTLKNKEIKFTNDQLDEIVHKVINYY